MDTATVYFLGAGASKDAGIPVTAGLLPRVKANIRDRSDRDDLRRFVQTFDTGGPDSLVEHRLWSLSVSLTTRSELRGL